MMQKFPNSRCPSGHAASSDPLTFSEQDAVKRIAKSTVKYGANFVIALSMWENAYGPLWVKPAPTSYRLLRTGQEGGDIDVQPISCRIMGIG
jgi:hypothetical protein